MADAKTAAKRSLKQNALTGGALGKRPKITIPEPLRGRRAESKKAKDYLLAFDPRPFLYAEAGDVPELESWVPTSLDVDENDPSACVLVCPTMPRLFAKSCEASVSYMVWLAWRQPQGEGYDFVFVDLGSSLLPHEAMRAAAAVLILRNATARCNGFQEVGRLIVALTCLSRRSSAPLSPYFGTMLDEFVAIARRFADGTLPGINCES